MQWAPGHRRAVVAALCRLGTRDGASQAGSTVRPCGALTGAHSRGAGPHAHCHGWGPRMCARRLLPHHASPGPHPDQDVRHGHAHAARAARRWWVGEVGWGGHLGWCARSLHRPRLLNRPAPPVGDWEGSGPSCCPAVGLLMWGHLLVRGPPAGAGQASARTGTGTGMQAP
jgi:hypothetical protein